MGEFYKRIIKKTYKSIGNQYYDNYDYEIGSLTRKMRVKLFLEKCGNFVLKKVNPKLSVYFCQEL